MPRYLIASLLMGSTFLSAEPSLAQGSKQDYERAIAYQQRMQDKVFRDRVKPNWINDGPDFWYRVPTSKDGYEFVLVRPEKKTRKLAFDHKRLAESLGERMGRVVNASAIPMVNLGFADNVITFQAFGRQWSLKNNELKEISRPSDGPTKDQSTAEVLDTIRPSGESSEVTQIRFINERAHSVKVFWIDSAGRRVAYGAIGPNKVRDQHTFASHTWLIVDEDERPVAGFCAVTEACTAYITTDSKIALPKSKRKTRRRGPRQGDSSAESPDGNWLAFVEGYNLYVRHNESGEVYTLSRNGNEGNSFRPSLLLVAR